MQKSFQPINSCYRIRNFFTRVVHKSKLSNFFKRLNILIIKKIPCTPHQPADLFSSCMALLRVFCGAKDLLWITWARVLFFSSPSRSGSGCTIKTSSGVRINPCCVYFIVIKAEKKEKLRKKFFHHYFYFN